MTESYLKASVAPECLPCSTTPHREKVGQEAGRADLETLGRVATGRWCVSNTKRDGFKRPATARLSSTTVKGAARNKTSCTSSPRKNQLRTGRRVANYSVQNLKKSPGRFSRWFVPTLFDNVNGSIRNQLRACDFSYHEEVVYLGRPK